MSSVCVIWSFRSVTSFSKSHLTCVVRVHPVGARAHAFCGSTFSSRCKFSSPPSRTKLWGLETFSLAGNTGALSVSEESLCWNREAKHDCRQGQGAWDGGEKKCTTHAWLGNVNICKDFYELFLFDANIFVSFVYCIQILFDCVGSGYAYSEHHVFGMTFPSTSDLTFRGHFTILGGNTKNRHCLWFLCVSAWLTKCFKMSSRISWNLDFLKQSQILILQLFGQIDQIT